MTIEYRIKSVYGNEMVYPANDVGNKFAELLKVKTFNASQMKQMGELGYELKQVI